MTVIRFCTTNRAPDCKQRSNVATCWLTWDMRFIPLTSKRPHHSATCCDACKAEIAASVQAEKVRRDTV